jgi:MFS transporter, ACS family, tartrate transporter
VLRAFFDPKVLLLSLNYVGIVTASLGMLLFLPQIIKELGVTNMQVGWIMMIPYIAGGISMVFCSWLSDRVGDRRWSLFTTCVISTVGLVIAGLTIGLWWSLAGITIAAIGFYGTQGTILVAADDVPDRRRCRRRDRVHQLARQSRRIFGPSLVGWAKDLTGSFAGGLYALALCALVSAVISLLWLHIPRSVPLGERMAATAD